MYDEAAFNEHLNENMADDPYGTATYIIRQALKGANQYWGTMSTEEAVILNAVGQALVKLDPSTVVDAPSPAEWNLEVDDPDHPEVAE